LDRLTFQRQYLICSEGIADRLGCFVLDSGFRRNDYKEFQDTTVVFAARRISMHGAGDEEAG
jgi:hypothetical protein